MDPVSTSTSGHQTRPLTQRERETLTALLERGTVIDPESSVTADDRARWLARVPDTLAGHTCGCGTCPSIELTDARDHTPASVGGRIVLEADAPGALLMLFIDDDLLSYLELAPLGDDSFLVFPASTSIGTG